MRRSGLARMLAMLLVALPAGVGACASRGSVEEQAGTDTFLLVTNNLPVPTSLTVYAVPQAGVRALVGTVRPGDVARLTFRPPSQQEYRFLARTTSGEQLLSNPVTVIPGEGVRWDLSSNIATEIRPN